MVALKGREISRRRANASLYNLSPVPFDDGSLFDRSAEERRSLSYITPSPFPLIRGRGIKGDGVNKLIFQALNPKVGFKFW